MATQTLNVFPAYLGGYDPATALTDWNDGQSPTLIITQDLGASAAYLVIGDEPEAADEVFEKHIVWPDHPVIWIDGGGHATFYRSVKDFVEIRDARFAEVFPDLNGVPQSPGVTFCPMPSPKPTSGFIEIGEYDGSAYAFENSVELLAGSDGRVYAVVAEHINDLPDLDDEGHPLRRGDLVKDEPKSGIRCPKCGSEAIFVVQVSCMQHTKPHTGRWPLAVDGFVWDESGSHRDGSTEDEIAECGDCRYCCSAGALHEFGFGEQTDEDEEAGDDVCDNCYTSGVTCDQTCPECGRTLCTDCAAANDGLCGECAAKADDESDSDKEYADMTDDELAEVKGQFSVDTGPDGEFTVLLDAINYCEGVANGHHTVSRVFDNEARQQVWEVDGRQ